MRLSTRAVAIKPRPNTSALAAARPVRRIDSYHSGDHHSRPQSQLKPVTHRRARKRITATPPASLSSLRLPSNHEHTTADHTEKDEYEDEQEGDEEEEESEQDVKATQVPTFLGNSIAHDYRNTSIDPRDMLESASVIAMQHQHDSLSSFLAHTANTGLSATSSLYKGTLYEYQTAQVLARFGMLVSRVGGSSDGGVDLYGRWDMDFEVWGQGKSCLLPSVESATLAIRPQRWCQVVCQCKNLSSGRSRPAMVRELEGAVEGFRARLGLDLTTSAIASRSSDLASQPILALLVTTRPSTAGVRAALTASDKPLGFVCLPFAGAATARSCSIATQNVASRRCDLMHGERQEGRVRQEEQHAALAGNGDSHNEEQEPSGVTQFLWNKAATDLFGLHDVGVTSIHSNTLYPPPSPPLSKNPHTTPTSTSSFFSSSVTPKHRSGESSFIKPPPNKLVLTLHGRALRSYPLSPFLQQQQTTLPHDHNSELLTPLPAPLLTNIDTELAASLRSVRSYLQALNLRVTSVKHAVLDMLTAGAMYASRIGQESQVVNNPVTIEDGTGNEEESTQKRTKEKKTKEKKTKEKKTKEKKMKEKKKENNKEKEKEKDKQCKKVYFEGRELVYLVETLDKNAREMRSLARRAEKLTANVAKNHGGWLMQVLNEPRLAPSSSSCVPSEIAHVSQGATIVDNTRSKETDKQAMPALRAKHSSKRLNVQRDWTDLLHRVGVDSNDMPLVDSVQHPQDGIDSSSQSPNNPNSSKIKKSRKKPQVGKLPATAKSKRAKLKLEAAK